MEVETDSGEVTVRLVATNAPDRDECFYREALDHLIATLRDKEVTLEVIGIDQFDRTLAHVFEGSRHVNLEMVSNGLALASSPIEDELYAGAILDAEETAFATGTGLWGATACGASVTSEVEVVGAESVTDPPGPDDDVLDAELLVVVNRSDEAIVDLSGWTLRDESSRHRFTFPAGSSIGPGETLSISSADAGWSPGGEPVWNNSGDMALLQDSAGNVASRWRY